MSSNEISLSKLEEKHSCIILIVYVKTICVCVRLKIVIVVGIYHQCIAAIRLLINNEHIFNV